MTFTHSGCINLLNTVLDMPVKFNDLRGPTGLTFSSKKSSLNN